MGTNYKAALIPQRIRETIHGWKKAARRKRRLGMVIDDATVHTDASTVISVEEYDDDYLENREADTSSHTVLDVQSDSEAGAYAANETSSRTATPLLRPCTSVPTSAMLTFQQRDGTFRSASMPVRRE